MFSIQEKDEEGFKKVTLHDDESNTYATIIPSCGAILQAFAAKVKGKFINVIESYSSSDDFNRHVTQAFMGTKLSPFVCRLHKGCYHFGEKDYKIQKFYIGDSAIHGILFDRSFTMTSAVANELYAAVTLQYKYRAEDAGYPFNYDCNITWQLEKENKLTVTTECINMDEGLIPMQDGWHPYFCLEDTIDELQLEFQSKEMVEFNEDLIPTGRLSQYHEFNSLKKIGDTALDNCFTLAMGDCQPLCVLRNPKIGIEVEIHPGEAYPYLQVYTPPHRRSIAIENISGPPDGFNNWMGVITLSPGESAFFKTAYKIKVL